jgi:hypothetical protein
MRRQTIERGLPALGALLAVLALVSSSGAAGRLGIGKMTVSPNRVSAGSTGNELTLTYTPGSGRFSGQMVVDVPPGWSPPQRRSAVAAGYVELRAGTCRGSTRITRIVARRISIAASCARRHSYGLLYHHATAPQIAADGYVFLTQSRPARKGKKAVFRPLGPRKQPVVRVRGAAAAGLFISTTSVTTAGAAMSVTVRAVDRYGNTAAGYTGKVTLTSTDPAATLPPPYSIGPADAAQHTFAGAILRTPGTQRITATESGGFSVQSGPITVLPVASGVGR